MKTRMMAVFLLVFLLFFSHSVMAEKTLMTRMNQEFDIASEELVTKLEEYGYSVAHIQRCDGGLTDFGYKTDLYRVVFFGKIEEVRNLSASYPQIVPYLPLKILMFAENEETVFVALNPDELGKFFKDKNLKIQFRRWTNDINAIFEELHSGI